jgi:hypothetical protein
LICVPGGRAPGRSGPEGPTNRSGKQGLKRSILTDAGGIPLGAVTAPANRRDMGHAGVG